MTEQIELGGDFRSADNGRERARRLVEHLLKRLKLSLQRAPGESRQPVSETFGRGVRAMRDRKGVVDENVAESRQRGDETGIVLFLAGMKARVLETKNVAGFHFGDILCLENT